MNTVEITATLRNDFGKKASKELRKENNVPCVLYGGKENVHFTSHENNLKKIIFTPNVSIIQLNIDGKKYNSILQDTQFHPVKDQLVHLDFLQIFDDKKTKISIPVVLNGLAPGVQEGGKLKTELRKLKVYGYAKDFPDTFNIDINKMRLGSTIKIEDLKFDNLELIDPASAVVVSVKLTRIAKGMEDGALEEEGEEGAEGSEDAKAEGGDSPEAKAEGGDKKE